MFSSRKSAAPAAGGYTIAKSLRFRSSASAYLNRTFGSGSTTAWTWSAWVKRGYLGANQSTVFFGDTSNTNYGGLHFTNDNLYFDNRPTAGLNARLITTQVFRDPSAWYHIVAVWNTANATSSDRLQLYVNGVRITAFSTATYPAQNTTSVVNTNIAHELGCTNAGSGGVNNFFDGYLAEVNFIDGQTLTPTSFGATNAATGVWQPIKYTGTYGTNGFYLKFTDTTSTSTLGNDSSGNNNTWTVNNISLTSGSTYDSMKDVPTLTDADTANYCTLNPLDVLSDPSTRTITNGNLNASLTNSWNGGATMAVSSGSWYCEATLTSNFDFYIGIDNGFASVATAYRKDGTRFNGSSFVSYGATYTTNDVIGMAFDVTNSTVTYYKNNVSQGQVTGVTYGSIARPFFYGVNGTTFNVNFGQRPFAYTPPSGFKALNTYNLPTPTIGATASTQANKYFDATTYTGNGSTQSIVNAGGFQPDLVWLKARSQAYFNNLNDSVRGTNRRLFSNTTDVEDTTANCLTAFNSNGFSIGSNQGINENTTTYVAWQWNGGGSNATNTSGTITSTVRANTTAGFSIVTYTGTGANATVGHGLGVAPKLVIVKTRNAVSGWITYHASLGNTQYLALNTTDAPATASIVWNNTSPTSSVFSLGTATGVNQSSINFVAYCFAEVDGYSRFGSYTGNGSTDGPFIFTNFQPRFVMVKRTDTTGDWYIWDTARNTYNVIDLNLYPNLSNAEATATVIDSLSNGFKIRNTTAGFNASGGTYIYACFSTFPFKYANAR